MRKYCSVLLLVSFLMCPIIGTAQTSFGEMEQKEITPIDSLVKTSVSDLKKAMAFFLTTKRKDYQHFKTKDDTKRFQDYLKEEFDHHDAFKAFMCFDNDDDIYARYSTGKKRRILPNITINLTNVKNRKSTKIRKNIRNLHNFYSKKKYNIDHIDIEKIQVFLVDEAVKKEGSDIGQFEYYAEHIFAIADFIVTNGDYKMVGHENDSFYINRGKSYWGLNRDEEKLLKENGVVVILGDVHMNIFYK